MATSVTESLLRRERLIVAAGLAVISALAWAYVLSGAGTGMSVRAMSRLAISPGALAGGMAMSTEWSLAYWLVMLLMWWVMMVAMMLPSAAPTILLYSRVMRHEQSSGRAGIDVAPTADFAAGYLATWLGFSAFATLLQFALERAGLVSSMMMWSLDPWLSAGVLLAAGLYQLTPLKQACLSHCRAPASFLSRHYRPGRSGALVMGMHHGVYCVGCCWALMALLFVGGIMNLLWIAGLAIAVLAEKLLPFGIVPARILGIACIAGAVWISARAVGLA